MADDRPAHGPNTPDALRALLAGTPWIVDALSQVRALDLPDGWIGAGTIRNAVWDAAHGRYPRPRGDVDVIYLDTSDTHPARDAALETRLTAASPGLRWEVRNQARMHLRHGDAPYRDVAEAIAPWVETATAVAARADARGRIHLLAPHGLHDLLGLVLRPVPAHAANRRVFDQRRTDKRWLERWPHLRVA